MTGRKTVKLNVDRLAGPAMVIGYKFAQTVVGGKPGSQAVGQPGRIRKTKRWAGTVTGSIGRQVGGFGWRKRRPRASPSTRRSRARRRAPRAGGRNPDRPAPRSPGRRRSGCTCRTRRRSGRCRESRGRWRRAARARVDVCGRDLLAALGGLAGDHQQRLELVGDRGVLESRFTFTTRSSSPFRWWAAIAP